MRIENGAGATLLNTICAKSITLFRYHVKRIATDAKRK